MNPKDLSGEEHRADSINDSPHQCPGTTGLSVPKAQRQQNQLRRPPPESPTNLGSDLRDSTLSRGTWSLTAEPGSTKGTVHGSGPFSSHVMLFKHFPIPQAGCYVTSMIKVCEVSRAEEGHFPIGPWGEVSPRGRRWASCPTGERARPRPQVSRQPAQRSVHWTWWRANEMRVNQKAQVQSQLQPFLPV